MLRLTPAVDAAAGVEMSATVGVGLGGRDFAAGSTAGSRAPGEDTAVAGLDPETARGWAEEPNGRRVVAPRVAALVQAAWPPSVGGGLEGFRECRAGRKPILRIGRERLREERVVAGSESRTQG